MRIAKKHSFGRISSGWPDLPPSLMECYFGVGAPDDLTIYPWQVPPDVRPSTNQWTDPFSTTSVIIISGGKVQLTWAIDEHVARAIDLGSPTTRLSATLYRSSNPTAGAGNYGGIAVRCNVGMTQHYSARLERSGAGAGTWTFSIYKDGVITAATSAIAVPDFVTGEEIVITDDGANISATLTSQSITVGPLATTDYAANAHVALVARAMLAWNGLEWDSVVAQP